MAVFAAARCRDLVTERPSGRLLEEWDELARAVDAPPWARPGWFVPWWQELARGDPQVAVLRGRSGALHAVVPLQAGRAVTSATNWHTPEFDVVAADAAARASLLRALVACSAPRLTLDFVSTERAEEVAEVGAALGLRVSRRVLERSPYLDLDLGSAWERDLDGHVLAELRRRARRLAERGEVRVDLRDGTDELDALLDEGLGVEASGWKGRQGSAVLSDPGTAAFYRAVCRWAAEQGQLRLAFLRLDGRALAFDLAVEHGGRHFLLKTGYDEGERAAAPGKQLRLEVLRTCACRGLQSFEFLGDAQGWKREWTSTHRDRWQVHAYAPGPSGAAAWTLHAGLLPLARRTRAAVGT